MDNDINQRANSTISVQQNICRYEEKVRAPLNLRIYIEILLDSNPIKNFSIWSFDSKD